MSIFAKYSLLDFIDSRNTSLSIGLKSISLSDGTDLKTEADCPCIIIEQLPDIQASIGSGFDLFIIRMFYKQIINDIDIEIIFDKVSSLFRKGDVRHEYSYAGMTTSDYFAYQDGSENKSGIQTAGNKLFYKQFMVYAPKTNTRR